MKPKVPLSVLLVDDDLNICRTLALSLQQAGCQVAQAHSAEEALALQAQSPPFDLLLTDFKMAGKNGIELVRAAQAHSPALCSVVMTAFATIENAVETLKAGAYDYLPKPFTHAQLEHLLAKVRTLVALKRENLELKGWRGRKDYFAGHTSPESARLQDFVRKVAPTDATLLLTGESGTGKSELARLIHDLSPRREGALVTVYCTTLTESLLESELFGHVKGAFTGAVQDKQGKLEQADGGTLFLDEIGDLSIQGQAKLLRFLQDKVFEPVGGHKVVSVNARVVAATNKDLRTAIADGRFREDLYYRLNALECVLPPLRQRKEDLPVMIQRLWAQAQADGKPARPLPAPVLDALLAYPWPGNIRELRNVLERVAMLSGSEAPELASLPDSVLKPAAAAAPADGKTPSLDQVERQHIEAVLAREKNLEQAAALLGITTVTLWRKRKEYGLI